MNIEELMEMWDTDSYIDPTELGDMSRIIPKLHAKYYNILIREKLKLRRFEAQMKTLKLEKHEFYTQGPNEETRAKGWKMPAKGMILKADLPLYMEADEDIITLSLKIGIQQEICSFLDSAIWQLKDRGYNIKNAIEWHKFTHGN